MNKTYEALYILNPGLIEDEANQFIDMIAGIVEQNGGTVLSKGIWDKRALAYEINHIREGIYCLMYFDAPSSVPALVNRAFRINDDVIRGIITIVDKRYVDTSEIKSPSLNVEAEETIVPDAEPVIADEDEAAPAEAAEPAEEIAEESEPAEEAVEDAEPAEEAEAAEPAPAEGE